MTDDEILKLADEYMDGSLNFRTVATEELLEFAKAIAAKERGACAKVCESMRPSQQEYDQRFYTACTLCADAIRARGE